MPEIPGAEVLPVDDNVAHLLLFTVLGLTLAWSRRAPPGPLRLSHPALVGLGIAYGASDEIHQMFVPGRTPSLADWGADIIGVALGYVIAITLLDRFNDARHA